MSTWTTPSPGRGSSRSSGSQPALRRQNTQRVVETLLRGGPTTQAKLARATGLSTGTISNIVKDLGDAQRITTRAVIDSGRRAIEIALRDQDRVVVGVDIDADRVRLALTRLDHEVLAQASRRLDAHAGPDATLRAVRALIDAELEQAGVAAADVLGAGVGLPAILSSRGDVLAGSFPSWTDTSLRHAAEAIFPFPVAFENDANLEALAQVSWGPYSPAEDLVCVTLGDGVGAGLFLDGRLSRGAVGAAGELGHVVIDPRGKTCRCGNRGCLETVCSLTRIATEIARGQHARQAPSDAEIVDLARRRDPITLRVLQTAGMALGQALGVVGSLLNPHAIVIASPLSGAGAPFLEPIARGLVQRAHPAFASGITLATSQLGPGSEALGGTALAAQRAPLVTR